MQPPRHAKPLALVLAGAFLLLASGAVAVQDVPAQQGGQQSPRRPGPGGGGPPGGGPGGRPGRGPGGGGPGGPGGRGGPPGGGPGARDPVGGPPESGRPLQDLWIPPLVTGKEISLPLAASSKSFWSGATTKTCGFAGADFWGPTVVLNQGEQVTLKVRNALDQATTVHWHGMHLPPAADGGPHQPIAAGASWTASFKVMNNAATYWYHPHPHGKTQEQLTLGAGGLIIVRDAAEAKLALPRTYGVDDLPLVLTSRRFRPDGQFSQAGDNDKYGDYLLANGTLDAQATLPAQVVRLRILNAEIERGYVLGLSDGRPFHVIATDGGLLDAPVQVRRLPLMVGERVEVLVDLGADAPGTSVDLMAFNSGQGFGFPGGEPGRTRPNGGYLNNVDFRLLHVNVGPRTDATAGKGAKPVTAIPKELVHNRFPAETDATVRRTLAIDGSGRPPAEFSFDGKPFDMGTTNMVVKLGDTEAWTIRNDRVFGHSFHIHDVQFRIVSRSGGAVGAHEQGWKDTVYVPRGQSVTFVARFEDFASDTDPFMYHCHMANHEDGGLMGQFLVSRNPAGVRRDAAGAVRFRDPMEHPLTPALAAAAAASRGRAAPAFDVPALDGRRVDLAALAAAGPVVLYFIDGECPCSRDAVPFVNALHDAFGDAATVVGVANVGADAARAWSKAAGPRFPVIADPTCAIIDAYGAERSVQMTVIGPGATVARAYPGYSAGTLREIAATLAAFGAAPRAQPDFAGAPEKLRVGCPLKDVADAVPATAGVRAGG